MPVRLDSRTVDFAQRFRVFLDTKREASADVEAAVRAIIADVAARGDRALRDLTLKFDRLDLDRVGLKVTQDEIAAAVQKCSREMLGALELARDRIEAFHRRQLPRDDRFTDDLGVELGSRWTAIEAVGLYVPGGTAAYPSSVLMNAVPAKVAGVPRLAMVVPAPGGELNPLVLAAAKLAGVNEVFRVGGAQAIAALAYGTETIAPVAKIVGPGNAYVAAAKRIVFGKVGIDMIAGPSEVLIVADRDGNPDWIAADLLAQAEHDASAQAILITDDPALADAVERAVVSQMAQLPRAAIAGAAWRDFGAVILVPSLDEALPLIDAIAPEHLEIAAANANSLADRIRNAGAIFIGAHTPEAIGDYVAGSNHVLPTARSARFSSGLGVLDFMKRTSILKCGPEQIARACRSRDRARDRGRFGRSRPLGGDQAQSLMARPPPKDQRGCLAAVTLDKSSIGRSSREIEHERAVAIYDLLEDNNFQPTGHDGGPYTLQLGISGTRLVFDIRQTDGTPVIAHMLSLAPFRRIVKDYFTVCDSYYAAIRTATPDRIEALDMGRRALHDEGSQIVIERLKRKVELDFDTARRLFTLITVLYWRG